MNDASAPTTDGTDDQQVRTISDAEAFKALADPTRLRLLAALMRAGQGDALPVMSVKELAADLGEPQTKLYRHVRQLESAGLVRSVASRVVSGIVEQRYQACQRDFKLGPGLTDAEKASTEAEATVAAVLEYYRGQFFAARRAGLIDSSPSLQADSHRQVILAMTTDSRLPVARAAEIRERLQQVLDDISRWSETGQDTVPVSVMIGYFSPDQAPG